uniref:Thiamine transporter 2 n=1 Tax=Glossina pallidipes TaxID=7398 RepID=A0A1A9ZR32_GLOPL
MQTWASISMLLCIFGFFRELRPSEPFVTEFLTSDFRNITSEQLNRLVYPFGTYAVFAQLILVFLLTDMLRYKPIIILSACAGIALFAILLWTRKIWELLIGQIFYGTFMASEVAYYTYIYAKVEKEHYQIVTGHTRAAILCGRFLAGVLAQILISTESMNYRQLHYISFGLQVVSFFVSVTLPPVKQSVYFYRIDDKEDHGRELAINASEPIKGTFAWRKAFKLLMKHAISGYTNATVIKWSIWWLLATAGQLQVISYAQILWKEIKGSESTYNGGVEAAATLLGAGGALAAAGAKIATQLCDDSFGLIFGINTFLALAVQSLLTILVATDTLGILLWVFLDTKTSLSVLSSASERVKLLTSISTSFSKSTSSLPPTSINSLEAISLRGNISHAIKFDKIKKEKGHCSTEITFIKIKMNKEPTPRNEEEQATYTKKINV